MEESEQVGIAPTRLGLQARDPEADQVGAQLA